jgi:hypothetical protein
MSAIQQLGKKCLLVDNDASVEREKGANPKLKARTLHVQNNDGFGLADNEMGRIEALCRGDEQVAFQL